MRRVGVWSGVVIGAVALGVGLSGCSFSASVGGPPVVAKADLQKDITDRLTEAGQTPKSVTCSEDLIGELDKTVMGKSWHRASNRRSPSVTTSTGSSAPGTIRRR